MGEGFPVETSPFCRGPLGGMFWKTTPGLLVDWKGVRYNGESHSDMAEGSGVVLYISQRIIRYEVLAIMGTIRTC